MIGHAGFHGPPGTNSAGAPAAVEFGYTILAPYRGHGLRDPGSRDADGRCRGARESITSFSRSRRRTSRRSRSFTSSASYRPASKWTTKTASSLCSSSAGQRGRRDRGSTRPAHRDPLRSTARRALLGYGRVPDSRARRHRPGSGRCSGSPARTALRIRGRRRVEAAAGVALRPARRGGLGTRPDDGRCLRGHGCARTLRDRLRPVRGSGRVQHARGSDLETHPGRPRGR